MVSFFSKISNWVNKKYKEYFVLPKVDKALSDLKSIIEDNNKIEENFQTIERARNVLGKYPDILADRKMSYLNEFLEGDLNRKMTTKLGENAGRKETKLSNLIAKSIDEKLAKELITNGNFVPLAKEQIVVPNVSANSINIMHCGTSGEKSRCLEGSKDFLMKKGLDEESADKKIEYLEKNYPYLLAVASLENIEKKNASSTIVTQRKGFDLNQYKKEVKFVNEAREELIKIAKNQSVDENKLKELNEMAKDVRKYHNTNKGILKDNNNNKNNIIGPADPTPGMIKTQKVSKSL